MGNLGADITENIKYSYGRPDSEVGGIKIKKFTGKGQNRKETSVISHGVMKFSSNLFHQCGDVVFQFFVPTI